MAVPASSEDQDVAFGKYLIANGIVTADQVREAYKLLVGYRASVPNVNLAQVMARHEMCGKDALRDAFARFKAADAAGGERFGFKTVELTPSERPDYSPIDTEGATLAGRPILDTEGVTLAGRPAFAPEGATFIDRGGARQGPGGTQVQRGPGATHGPGSTHPGAGSRGPAHGPGSTHPGGTHPGGSHAPARGPAHGPGSTHPGAAQARGPGSTQPGASHGPGGTHPGAISRGPGGTHPEPARGPGGTHPYQTGGGLAGFGTAPGGFGGSGFGSGPGGSGFGSNPAGSAFGTRGGGNKPKIDLPSAAAIPLESEEAEEGEEHDETNLESSTQGAATKQRKKARKASPIAEPRRVPMGLFLGIGVAVVLVVGVVSSRVLHARAVARAKADFLLAVQEKPAEEALAVGEALDPEVQGDPEVNEQLERLRKVVAAARARAEAERILAGLSAVEDLEKRITICTQASEADPTFAKAYVERARAKYALGKRKALQAKQADLRAIAQPAVQDLNTAMQHDPESPWPYYVRALILLENRRDAEARGRAAKDLEKVQTLDPEGQLGLLAKGRLEMLRRRYDEAIGLFEKAINVDPRVLDGYLARAEARLQLGTKDAWAGALRDANQAVEIDKTSAAAFTLRAEARFLANTDRTGAMRDLDEALRLDPTQISALALRAYVRLERRDTGEIESADDAVASSERDARQALALDDGQAYAQLALAEIEQKRGNLQQALHHATKAIDNSFKWAEAYLVHGRLRILDGDTDRALDDFEQVLQIDANHARAMTMKASILVNRRDYDTARGLLDRALEIAKDFGFAWFTRGLIHYNARPANLKKAIEDFSEALGHMPSYANAYFYRAAAYHDWQHFQDALNDLNQAEALRKKGLAGVEFPECDLYLIRGHCHYRRDEFREAHAAYGEYIRLAPPTASAIGKVRARITECSEKMGAK